MPSETKWKFGALNPQQKPKDVRRLETNSNNPLHNAREAVRDLYYNKKFDLRGEYIGIVLMKLDATHEHADSVSFIDRAWTAVIGPDKPEQISAKIRVPEIHAALPEPTDQFDFRNISLHDTFNAVVDDLGVSELVWNQVVVVSFYDSIGTYRPTIKRIYAGGENRDGLSNSSASALTNVNFAEGVDVCGDHGDQIGSGEKGAENQVPCPPPISGLKDLILKNHIGKTVVEILPAAKFKQNRVRIHEGIAPVPAGSSLLTNVRGRPSYAPSSGILHTLVAERFSALVTAASSEGIEVYSHSGWRPHRWKSRSHYEKKMIKDYGSVKAGRKKVAYISPHESGLAVDFFIPAQDSSEVDVAPSRPGDHKYGSRTNSEQKQTKAYKWLKANAHTYGFTPYSEEAWHWECLIPINAWKTGQAVAQDYDITRYDVRTKETSIANGTKTSDRNFTFE